MSFETFTWSVEYTGPEKFPCKATCVLAFFFENPRILADAKVLNEIILIVLVQLLQNFENRLPFGFKLVWCGIMTGVC